MDNDAAREVQRPQPVLRHTSDDLAAAPRQFAPQGLNAHVVRHLVDLRRVELLDVAKDPDVVLRDEVDRNTLSRASANEPTLTSG